MPLFSYQLTIIDDEPVALAGSIPGSGPAGQAVWYTILTAVFITAVLVMAAYQMRLSAYRTRLRELTAYVKESDDAASYHSIRKLKSRISIIESRLAEDALVSMISA